MEFTIIKSSIHFIFKFKFLKEYYSEIKKQLLLSKFKELYNKLEQKYKIKIKNKFITSNITSSNKIIKLLKGKFIYIILNPEFFSEIFIIFILKFLKYLLLESIIFNNYNITYLINNIRKLNKGIYIPLLLKLIIKSEI